MSATQLIVGRPLIVGFNWDARKSGIWGPQESCPSDRFIEVYHKGWLGPSMARIVPFLVSYLGAEILESIGQINYCFFRSAGESDICEADLQLCQPIFLDLLTDLRPERVLCFSARLRQYWDDAGMLDDVRRKSVSFAKTNSVCSYEARVAILRGSGTPIYFLPHPNYAMTAAARDAVWRFAFDGK